MTSGRAAAVGRRRAVRTRPNSADRSILRDRQSSDQRAPGLSLLWGRGGGVLASRGDFRVPGLSLRMERDDAGLEEFD